MDLRTMYRDIVETSPDGIWVIDAAGRDQFAAHLEELRRGEVHRQEVECLWVRGDGEQLWVSLRESPLYDELGDLQGFLHRVSDYSDRRRLFQELTYSKHLLAEAQRIAKVGSYEWDLVNDAIVASDELHVLYGISREEFGGTYDDFIALVHPEDREAVQAAVQHAVEGNGTIDFVARVQRGDGSLIWARGRGEIFRDEAGTPVRVRGTHQDVTDAKESEEILHDLVAQNTLMQAVATAANEAETLIDVLSVAQRLVLQHDDWVRGRGYLPNPDPADDRLVQLHLDPTEHEEDLAEPEVVAFERALAEEVQRTGGQVWDEKTHPGRPTIAFPVQLGGQVAAVIVITASTPFVRQPMIRTMIDQVAVQLGRVAERDRAARELAAARDAAMEASRQKSEFLATMSHEIRTPLNGVIGLNDLLLRTDLDAHQQRLAAGAQVASRALLSVVNDILDFSKIEAGRLELESVDFDVRQVFDEVASVLGESARAKGLELLVSCHPAVPDHLNGDPTRLAQVLTNLGSNAVKFTESGEVSIRATAEPGERGRTTLRVEVTDTGIGVGPEQRVHIFDAFSQADASTTREYGGTGLGLAISREVVSALGGEIDVVSSPGEGATFWFTASFGTAPDAAGRAEDAELLAGRRVLVVDDNATNRVILAENLARWDTRCDTAAGALEALERMRAAEDADDPYDVLLLDLAMPGHDGLELARMIAEDDRLAGAALVMLTSTTEIEPDALASAGVVECLTKPVLAGDVQAVLLRVLGEEGGGRAARTSARTTSARSRQAGVAVPPVERRRLLVVEDNPVNQLVALGILETLGYAADAAGDGVEALEMWKVGRYDAVLMDVQMPRLDGYAATRALRELEPEGARTPVLAVTAAAIEGERERCLAAGMDDFLTKPVNPGALEAMLGRWLDDTDNDDAVADLADAHEPGVLDEERLAMLRDLDPGNTAYLDQAIANFAARVTESLQTLRGAIAAGDHEALTQSAHRLKGSSLNLGLPVVGHLAHELEMIGDAGTTTGSEALVGSLEAAMSRAIIELRWYQEAYQSVDGRSGPLA